MAESKLHWSNSATCPHDPVQQHEPLSSTFRPFPHTRVLLLPPAGCSATLIRHGGVAKWLIENHYCFTERYYDQVSHQNAHHLLHITIAIQLLKYFIIFYLSNSQIDTINLCTENAPMYYDNFSMEHFSYMCFVYAISKSRLDIFNY